MFEEEYVAMALFHNRIYKAEHDHHLSPEKLKEIVAKYKANKKIRHEAKHAAIKQNQ